LMKTSLKTDQKPGKEILFALLFQPLSGYFNLNFFRLLLWCLRNFRNFDRQEAVAKSGLGLIAVRRFRQSNCSCEGAIGNFSAKIVLSFLFFFLLAFPLERE